VVAAAIGNQYRVTLKTQILEPTEGVGLQERYPGYQPNPNWPRERLLGMIEEVCNLGLTYEAEVTFDDSGTDTTNVAVLTDPKEPTQLVEALGMAMQIIFNAAGKKNGRQLFLDVSKNQGESVRDLSNIW